MLITKSELAKVRPTGMEMRVDTDASGESLEKAAFRVGLWCTHGLVVALGFLMNSSRS
jgi:hypothetical protein